jgi:hypothetical protein
MQTDTKKTCTDIKKHRQAERDTKKGTNIYNIQTGEKKRERKRKSRSSADIEK